MVHRALQVVLVAVLTVAVLWAGGLLPPLAQEGRRLADRAVHGGPGEVAMVTVAITRAEVERMATKTQTYDSAGGVGGEIAVLNQETSPMMTSAATKKVQVTAGVFQAVIEDITTSGWGGPDPQPSPPAGTEFTFAYYLMSAVEDQRWGHGFYYFTDESATPWDFAREFAIRVTGRRLTREESTSYGPGRHGKPVYAKERTMKDAWTALAPASWEVTFGDLSTSGTQEWSGAEWLPVMYPVNSVSFGFWMHKGADATQYARASLEWAEWPVDFTGGAKTFGTIYKVVGAGNVLTVVTTAGGVSEANHSVGMNEPLVFDFRQFYIRDRRGNPVGDNTLRIDGPFQATPRHSASLSTWSANPDGTGTPSPGDKCYPTPALLRAVGVWTEGPSRITGLDYDDADMQKELVTSNALGYELTPESMRLRPRT